MNEEFEIERKIIGDSTIEEDTKNFIEILKESEELQESDKQSAYELAKKSLQVYYRWTVIKALTEKQLGRGEKVYLKKHLEDICKTSYEIYQFARMVWKQSSDNLRNNREDI